MTDREPPDQDTAASEMIRLLDLSARQAAEIERLRAALREIHDSPDGARIAAADALGPALR